MIQFPPTNLILKGLVDGLSKNKTQNTDRNLDKSLQKFGDRVEIDKTSSLKKRFRDTVKKVVVKKTGKRII